jgi:FkbM family methyltransferase
LCTLSLEGRPLSRRRPHHGRSPRPLFGYNGALKTREMKMSVEFLRPFAYKLLPWLPVNFAHWFRNRVLLRYILRKLSISCVLDVGANRGQFGTLLRGIGYTGWIISFEPIQANYEVLKAAAAQREPWRVFPYALGATNERREINVAEETVFSSFLTPREESQVRFPTNKLARKEEVDVRRLDCVLETCLMDIPPPRIYLKLDTQGFDLSVMEGAQAILPRVLALQTEVSLHNLYHGMHNFVDSISKFRAAGFEVIDFVTVNRDIDQLCAVEMDCIMARKPDWSRPEAGGAK